MVSVVVSTASSMDSMSMMIYIVFLLIVHCHMASCMRNFALNKFANQSSTLPYEGFNWSADKAVDGNTSGLNPETSKTCSATANNRSNHTWEVEIGFIVIVKKITVYGRVPPVDQLSDFQLYVGNESNSWLTNLPLVGVHKQNNTHIFIVNNLAARVISVVRRNSWILTLCEVTVEGECLDGVYSAYCNKTCGRCHNGHPCDKETGICPHGCDPGWREVLCNVECDEGTYGYGCNETCGNCLNGTNKCLRTNGRCIDGCKAGWQGDKCIKACEKGRYGHGCNETCGQCLGGSNICSIIDGNCTGGCQVGWQGEKCKLEKKKNLAWTNSHNLIIAVVLAVIAVMIVIVVSAVITVKRRRSKQNEMVANRKHHELNLVPRVSEVGGCQEPQQEEIEEMPVPEERVYRNTARKAQLMAQCIPHLSFWDYVMKKKANKEESESEFQDMTKGLSKTYDAALANPLKNRYKSMYPYDFNRVVLKRGSTECPNYVNGPDYINASHIKGYHECKHYIAAQGPTNKTVDDFWWMVWQERTECIVMLTNLMEMGKVKCIQYWPDANEQVYSEVMVQILQTEYFPDYIKRHLNISVGDRSRNVAQFHYKAWPDQDVPDTAWSLVEFWKAVGKHKTCGNGPMIVHCSAGVGRTGTFLALDIIYDQTCDKGHVSVMKYVENLREQRVNMVQTESQYMFLHDVIAEALGIGTMHILQKQVSKVLLHLIEKDEQSGMTRLERQYNMLLSTDQDENSLQVYSNTPEFQSKKIWLPNLSGTDTYIAMKSTGDEEILTVIRQNKVKFVIDVERGNAMDAIFFLQDNQCKVIADCKITRVEQAELRFFERTLYAITNDQKTESMDVTVFTLKDWKNPREVPEDTNSVMSLVGDVNQRHPSPDNSNPILLYSRSDLTRCGVIYILMVEINRAHRDGEIYILQTVLGTMAKSRTLLPTFEQYLFLYKCLASDVVPDSTYENAISMSTIREIL